MLCTEGAALRRALRHRAPSAEGEKTHPFKAVGPHPCVEEVAVAWAGLRGQTGRELGALARALDAMLRVAANTTIGEGAPPLRPLPWAGRPPAAAPVRGCEWVLRFSQKRREGCKVEFVAVTHAAIALGRGLAPHEGVLTQAPDCRAAQDMALDYLQLLAFGRVCMQLCDGTPPAAALAVAAMAVAPEDNETQVEWSRAAVQSGGCCFADMLRLLQAADYDLHALFERVCGRAARSAWLSATFFAAPARARALCAADLYRCVRAWDAGLEGRLAVLLGGSGMAKVPFGGAQCFVGALAFLLANKTCTALQWAAVHGLAVRQLGFGESVYGRLPRRPSPRCVAEGPAWRMAKIEEFRRCDRDRNFDMLRAHCLMERTGGLQRCSGGTQELLFAAEAAVRLFFRLAGR